jgi:hypothetical protein
VDALARTSKNPHPLTNHSLRANLLPVIIAALVFAGCQCLVLGCFALLLRRWYLREISRIQDEISEAVRTFVSSPGPDLPSPLAVFMDNVALLLAARLVQQVKAMLAGVESGESKGEQLALIEEATQGSPWLALLSGILPKRIRNKLMKNPQMIGWLSNLGGNHSAAANVAPRRHRE